MVIENRDISSLSMMKKKISFSCIVPSCQRTSVNQKRNTGRSFNQVSPSEARIFKVAIFR